MKTGQVWPDTPRFVAITKGLCVYVDGLRSCVTKKKKEEKLTRIFSSEVNWPVCTEKDNRIGLSDIVWNQPPPMSFAKHTEHEE